MSVTVPQILARGSLYELSESKELHRLLLLVYEHVFDVKHVVQTFPQIADALLNILADPTPSPAQTAALAWLGTEEPCNQRIGDAFEHGLCAPAVVTVEALKEFAAQADDIPISFSSEYAVNYLVDIYSCACHSKRFVRWWWTQRSATPAPAPLPGPVSSVSSSSSSVLEPIDILLEQRVHKFSSKNNAAMNLFGKTSQYDALLKPVAAKALQALSAPHQQIATAAIGAIKEAQDAHAKGTLHTWIAAKTGIPEETIKKGLDGATQASPSPSIFQKLLHLTNVSTGSKGASLVEEPSSAQEEELHTALKSLTLAPVAESDMSAWIKQRTMGVSQEVLEKATLELHTKPGVAPEVLEQAIRDLELQYVSGDGLLERWDEGEDIQGGLFERWDEESDNEKEDDDTPVTIGSHAGWCGTCDEDVLRQATKDLECKTTAAKGARVTSALESALLTDPYAEWEFMHLPTANPRTGSCYIIRQYSEPEFERVRHEMQERGETPETQRLPKKQILARLHEEVNEAHAHQIVKAPNEAYIVRYLDPDNDSSKRIWEFLDVEAFYSQLLMADSDIREYVRYASSDSSEFKHALEQARERLFHAHKSEYTKPFFEALENTDKGKDVSYEVQALNEHKHRVLKFRRVDAQIRELYEGIHSMKDDYADSDKLALYERLEMEKLEALERYIKRGLPLLDSASDTPYRLSDSIGNRTFYQTFAQIYSQYSADSTSSEEADLHRWIMANILAFNYMVIVAHKFILYPFTSKLFVQLRMVLGVDLKTLKPMKLMTVDRQLIEKRFETLTVSNLIEELNAALKKAPSLDDIIAPIREKLMRVGHSYLKTSPLAKDSVILSAFIDIVHIVHTCILYPKESLSVEEIRRKLGHVLNLLVDMIKYVDLVKGGALHEPSPGDSTKRTHDGTLKQAHPHAIHHALLAWQNLWTQQELRYTIRPNDAETDPVERAFIEANMDTLTGKIAEREWFTQCSRQGSEELYLFVNEVLTVRNTHESIDDPKEVQLARLLRAYQDLGVLPRGCIGIYMDTESGECQLQYVCTFSYVDKPLFVRQALQWQKLLYVQPEENRSVRMFQCMMELPDRLDQILSVENVGHVSLASKLKALDIRIRPFKHYESVCHIVRDEELSMYMLSVHPTWSLDIPEIAHVHGLKRIKIRPQTHTKEYYESLFEFKDEARTEEIVLMVVDQVLEPIRISKNAEDRKAGRFTYSIYAASVAEGEPLPIEELKESIVEHPKEAAFFASCLVKESGFPVVEYVRRPDVVLSLAEFSRSLRSLLDKYLHQEDTIAVTRSFPSLVYMHVTSPERELLLPAMPPAETQFVPPEPLYTEEMLPLHEDTLPEIPPMVRESTEFSPRSTIGRKTIPSSTQDSETHDEDDEDDDDDDEEEAQETIRPWQSSLEVPESKGEKKEVIDIEDSDASPSDDSVDFGTGVSELEAFEAVKRALPPLVQYNSKNINDRVRDYFKDIKKLPGISPIQQQLASMSSSSTAANNPPTGDGSPRFQDQEMHTFTELREEAPAKKAKKSHKSKRSKSKKHKHDKKEPESSDGSSDSDTA
jgi:hypothetical protein